VNTKSANHSGGMPAESPAAASPFVGRKFYKVGAVGSPGDFSCGKQHVLGTVLPLVSAPFDHATPSCPSEFTRWRNANPGRVGVKGDCLREFLDSGCTKRCALQRRSRNCLQARVWNSSSPLNLVFVTASCFGSDNGIFYHFLNQWHRFNRGSRKQITTAPVG
jgi:hypothetical protein